MEGSRLRLAYATAEFCQVPLCSAVLAVHPRIVPG